MRASWRSSRRGMATSSASRRATYVPRASSRPRFSEPARPTCSSLRSTRRRGSSTLARISGVASRGRVVDDDELEIGDGLTEDARERSPDVCLAVVDGDEHGDERCGGHGRPVAYGPCRRTSPSFDLVVATVGRTDELGRFLDSLEAQGYRPYA